MSGQTRNHPENLHVYMTFKNHLTSWLKNTQQESEKRQILSQQLLNTYTARSTSVYMGKQIYQTELERISLPLTDKRVPRKTCSE